MINLNKLFTTGVFASILAVNYISPVIANKFPPACHFIHQVGTYPEDPITECRNEGDVARYLAYNNYGIKEEDFNTMVTNVMVDKIKTLNYTLTSSVYNPNPYNYFPESINQINLDELELNCHNDFSTDVNQVSLGTCVIQDNVLQSPTMKRLTLRRINLTQNNMKEIGNITTLEKLSFYDNEFSNVSFQYLKNLINLNELTYGYSSLTVLPRGALNRKYFQDVKILTVSGVQLSDINIKEINALYALEKFTLDNAYFSDEMLEFYFLNKTNLNEVNLDFSSNQGENIVRDISIKLPESTKKLYIKGANIKNVSLKQISKYDPYLEEIHFKNAFFEDNLDFKNLRSLTNLTKLTLEYNRGVTEAKNIKYLKSLKSLNLIAFDITEEFLNQITTLPQLEELYIFGSNLLGETERRTVKFNNIKKLVNLQKLNIQICGFEFDLITDKIYTLSNLKELVLIHNNFVLDKRIKKLTNLENLQLVSNELTGIPEEIGTLKNLKYLEIYYNNVDSLPSSIGQLTNLEVLALGSNNLNSLPDEIGDLSNLTRLTITSNKFEEIPDFINKLENLKTLDARNNKILEISDKVFELKNLEYLNLSRNNITSIPNDFDAMSKLTTLDLSDNNIDDELPKSLNDLSYLTSVFFYNNINIRGKVINNTHLKECRYCSLMQNNCSSKDCYDDNYMNLPISTDGRCGKGHARCPLGSCCSKDGYCDSFYDQCFMSNGCQPKYGTCKKPCMTCELDLTQNDFEFDENALPTSHNGRCGKDFGTKCPFDYCCTKEGYCGGGRDDCDAKLGCQEGYGLCLEYVEPKYDNF